MSTQLLHPEAVLYVFRHGHAAPAANGDEGDFGRILSEKGVRQAQQLGLAIQAAGIEFEQVICSAAPRSQNTGNLASRYFDYGNWYNGTGRELYGPVGDKDYAEMWRVTHMIEDMFNKGTITSPMSYAVFRNADITGFLDRFIEETRQVVLTLPGIAEARRIAIFDHAVIGNAVAEALFPQHYPKLMGIELAPCDGIRLTATTCQHIPLMT